MSRSARIAAFSRVGETCPEVSRRVHAAVKQAFHLRVDDTVLEQLPRGFVELVAYSAFEAARDHGTERLRDALIECERELELERERADAAEELARERAATIDDLEDQLRSLREELEEARSTASS